MPNQAVYKSTAAEFLDDFLSGASEGLDATFGYALGLLESDSQGQLSQTTQVLVHDNKLPERSTQDFEAYWLSDTSQLAGKDVGRVMRHGYAEAIRIARGQPGGPVPIETLWVTGASDDFELHICEGPGHVTVLLFIPLVRAYGSKRASKKSWVVRVGSLREDGETLDPADPPIIKVQVSGRPDAS